MMFHLISVSQEYAESAINELLGWYGYCNNNEHSLSQINFMTNNKPSAMHSTKMPKHTISQTSTSLATSSSTSNGHRSYHTPFDDFDTNMDSRSSTDDSMSKLSPNFVTKGTMQSNLSQEKPQLGKIYTHCSVQLESKRFFLSQAIVSLNS